jgi:hypothetical protein
VIAEWCKDHPTKMASKPTDIDVKRRDDKR